MLNSILDFQTTKLITESKNINYFLSPKLTQFIEKNINLIDNEEWEDLFNEARLEHFVQINYTELFNILDKVLEIPEDVLKEQGLHICEQVFMDVVKDQMVFAAQDPFERKINSWSRFQYIMDGIGEFPVINISEDDFLKHLLKPETQKKLNLNLKPLPAEYGWHGEGDYDLGQFNKKEFDAFYNNFN